MDDFAVMTDAMAIALVAFVAITKIVRVMKPIEDRVERHFQKRCVDLILATAFFLLMVRMICFPNSNGAYLLGCVGGFMTLLAMGVDMWDVYRIKKHRIKSV